MPLAAEAPGLAKGAAATRGGRLLLGRLCGGMRQGPDLHFCLARQCAALVFVGLTKSYYIYILNGRSQLRTSIGLGA